MECPVCSSRILGTDCAKCANPVPGTCPACKHPFLPCDQYCRACGRELRFVNFTNHPVLRHPEKLLINEYEYPSDRIARKAMSALWPVQVLVRYAIENITEPTIHGTLLGSAVKVSRKQFPHIKRIGDLCMRLLSVDNVELFINTSQGLNAQTYGLGSKAIIVLTSGLVRNLDPSELLFVIGHEMGHVKSDHILFLTIIDMIRRGLMTIPMLGTTILDLLTLVFLPWQRNSEVTADRAGLICCQSLQTATKALTKIALGSRELFNKVDLDEFLGQHDDLKEQGAWGEYMQIHPFILTRIRMLQQFMSSPSWFRIMNNAYTPHRPGFHCYYCRHKYELTDFDAVLRDLRCRYCGRNLFLEEILCPHCGHPENLAGRDVSCATFICSVCERPYFLNNERHMADAWNNSLPDCSAYSVLEIPYNASNATISAAYVEKMNPKGEKPSIEKRITYTKAYKQLSNVYSRMRHNTELAILLCEQINAYKTDDSRPTVACAKCGIKGFDAFCCNCGEARNTSNPGSRPPVTDAETVKLKQALRSEQAFGANLVFHRTPPFEIAFSAGSRSYYLALLREDMTTPSKISSLVEATNRLSRELAEKSWIHSSGVFIALFRGNIDSSLLSSIAAHQFINKRGLSGTFSFRPYKVGNDGEISLIAVSWPESTVQTDREPVSFNGYEELAAHLASTD